jgi:hypothetical protein
VLAVAAAYQLTRSKRAWLARCRGPLAAADLARAERPGRAVSIGVNAGLSCVASSWALMAALFALGAMSLLWMALVSVLIVAERLAPGAARARLLAVPVLVALAVGVAAAPAHVPGLTIPGSPAANAAMMRMGMDMSTGMPGMHMQTGKATAAPHSAMHMGGTGNTHMRGAGSLHMHTGKGMGAPHRATGMGVGMGTTMPDTNAMPMHRSGMTEPHAP